jgi:hypothetical protein
MKGAAVRAFQFGIFLILVLQVLFDHDIFAAEYFGLDSSNAEKKLEKLNQANAELNKLFSKKLWNKIYDMLSESRLMDATNFTLQNRNTFVMERERASPWFISWKTKTLSTYIDQVDGLTSNIVEMKIKFFPFKTYKDTTYHYWKYHNSEWYLIDFGNDISREWKEKIDKN